MGILEYLGLNAKKRKIDRHYMKLISEDTTYIVNKLSAIMGSCNKCKDNKKYNFCPHCGTEYKHLYKREVE